VTWTIQNNTLVRNESIVASKPLTIRRLYLDFPSTAGKVSTSFNNGLRIDRFDSPDGGVEVSVTNSSLPLTSKFSANGNSALGRGSRGPIPLTLEFEARDIPMKAGIPVSWTITLAR